jgi:large subunit ribosomal protein L29
MKAKDIKQLTADELTSKVTAEKESLKKMKFAHAISPIENPMQIRVSRKEVARLLTEKNSRVNSNK